MIKYSFTFIICLLSSAVFSQKEIETIDLNLKLPAEINYFSLGVEQLSKSEYKKADSLFTLSFEAGDRTIDTYFDRALARKKLGNICGFCVDMLCAAELGDEEANSLFWKNCIGLDSVLLCVKNMRVVLEDTIAVMTNFDSISNIKRISIVQQVKGLSHRYFVNANGKVDTFKLDDPVYSLMGICEQPEFPGGDRELFTFLRKNISYPPDERDRGIQGKVYVSFVIDQDGSVTDIDLYKGIVNGAGLTVEALRIVKLMPKWKPGTQNGKNVRTKYILPIHFKLG